MIYPQTELLNSVHSNECTQCHQFKDIKSFADNHTCTSCSDYNNRNINAVMQNIDSALQARFPNQNISAHDYLREAASLSIENGKLQDQLKNERDELNCKYNQLFEHYNKLIKYVDRAEWHNQLRENYHTITDQFLVLH